VQEIDGKTLVDIDVRVLPRKVPHAGKCRRILFPRLFLVPLSVQIELAESTATTSPLPDVRQVITAGRNQALHAVTTVFDPSDRTLFFVVGATCSENWVAPSVSCVGTAEYNTLFTTGITDVVRQIDDLEIK